jgi:flagellar M-ring protein FliF
VAALPAPAGAPALGDGSAGTQALGASAAPLALGNDGSGGSGGGETMINIAQIEGQMRASSIRRISELAEKHPEEAVSVVRSWMAQES